MAPGPRGWPEAGRGAAGGGCPLWATPQPGRPYRGPLLIGSERRRSSVTRYSEHTEHL